MKKCPICDRKIEPNNNDGRSRGICNSCRTKIRRYRAKRAAIEYLGGKCVRCGYDKHPAALEFHHATGEKDFAIGMVANRKWELIKNELDKCELLCSTCHRIEHSNRDSAVFIEYADRYRGRPLWDG